MKSRITQAQPALEFIPPHYQPFVRQMGRSLVRFWLRWRKGITRTEVTNPDALIHLYQQFHAGKIRFMVAFRHPTTIDPLVISHTLWNRIPSVAQQQGKSLTQPPHVHFVYDRGIPLWAGSAVTWLISRLGGTPIRRGSLDTVGLRSIRQLFTDGRFPMAAAPEGGINGHNEIVSPIEPGIAQFGFWCVDDLKKADRDEEVLIVPLGIQYIYEAPPWKSVADLLSQLEIDSGLRSPNTPISQNLATLQDGQTPTQAQQEELYQRLHALGQYLLSKMENFYCTYYNMCRDDRVSLSDADSKTDGDGPDNAAFGSLGERLHTLLSMALKVAEESLGIRKPKGSLTDRCRRVEQAAWDRIYRTEVNDADSLNLLDRGLVDLVAEEANLRLWHMHLVETFVSVTGKYVAESPTIERFADTTLLIWKMMQQIGHVPANDFPKL
ncbi:MAG: 1-acyl-sn-glycerol-3-phosphate acyltransferase, partial [Leptolyngbyaceae bacterium]|nr:1-acyl-sn-glycerol-3-phosphate acyltransferase [Leptolyngbyaceae bacterium]